MARCTTCFKVLDGFLPLDDQGRGPKEGDVSVCFYCGTIAEFDNNGDLIEIPPEKIRKLPITDQLQLKKVSEKILSRIKQN